RARRRAGMTLIEVLVVIVIVAMAATGISYSLSLGDTLRPSFGASPFSAVSGSRYQARELASGIAIRQLIVPHEPEPRTEGRGAIYLFPGGQTEHAVRWVGDDSDRVVAIELHPLTGRTRVYDYAYEPEAMLDDGRGRARSEVRD